MALQIRRGSSANRASITPLSGELIFTTDTLQQALDNDVFALVTFNSVAAIESIYHGIPAFTLAPCNAASPVSLQDPSQIENPYYPNDDKLHAWGKHLAYGQFHVSEMKDGSALTKLKEWW